VDWNNSGSFTDNSNKYTVIHNIKSKSLTGSGIIVVPAAGGATGSTVGSHKMRIRANYNSDLVQANVCSNLEYGEQEDYTVNVIQNTTGVDNLNSEQHLNIYPNPVTNELIIETSNNDLFNISLTNIVGQTVKQLGIRNYELGITHYSVIDMKNLANGMYLIKIFNEKEVLVKKIIKQ
jgi:hypothetical protein